MSRPKMVEGSRQFLTNTRLIFAESFSSPGTLTTITLPGEPPVKNAKMAYDEAIKERPPIYLPPAFKWTIIIVSGLTLLSGVAALAIAFCAPNPLTAAQQSIFDKAADGFQLGFGALVGLLGGKQMNGGPR
jgi:hypothetical protein